MKRDLGNYEISDERNLIQADKVHAYLSHESYWAKDIPLEIVKRSIENSLCWGVYFQGEQIGFARMITDYSTFAYLADVYIVEEHRGKGLSKLLMHEIMAHPRLQGLRRIMLATRDAHSLYTQFGFAAPENPASLMQIVFPGIYSIPDKQ
jgi:GNAT superfamily N-acetyltransferase